MTHSRIGLGGGFHWCTEAVFQVLRGVAKVDQGWIASIDEQNTLSEAVIVHFNPKEILLDTLIEVHLYTHSSTSNHSMRKKYRSAVYCFSKEQEQASQRIIDDFQTAFKGEIITQIYPFNIFSPSSKDIQNYYLKNPNKPFCKQYIHPKLKLVVKRFAQNIDQKSVEK